MAQPTIWPQLQQSLQQDAPLTHKLIELFTNEKKALESRDYALFQQLSEQKQLLIGQLEQQAKQRQQLLAHASMSEKTALEQARQQQPALAKQWLQLSEDWKKCQEMNEVNERVAQRTKLVVSKMLDMLRGQNNQQRLYTQQGSTAPSTGGRSITSA
ncbi:flagellar protein FlgN [bacterium]|nr:flagellar protein FlgN [bacterium]